MTVNPTAKRRIRIEASFPGTCSCGRSILPGSEVDYNPDSKKIIGCQGCEFTGHAQVAMPELRWRSVAAALRRRKEREEKARKKRLAGAED